MYVGKRQNSQKRIATTSNEIRNIVIANCVICAGYFVGRVIMRKEEPLSVPCNAKISAAAKTSGY